MIAGLDQGDAGERVAAGGGSNFERGES